MPPSLDTDVTPLDPRYRPERRRFRWVMGTLGLVLVIAWVAVLADEFSTHVAPQAFSSTTSAASYADWLLFIGLALAAGVSIWAAMVLGAEGASRVVVDDDGIRFTWRNGRSTALRWDSPRFRLDLWVVPKAPNTPDDLQVAARAKLRFHGPTDLPEEAFQAILEGAGAHGLTVVKRRWHGVFPSDPISTLMIRPKRR
jgi:hypothetical protein